MTTRRSPNGSTMTVNDLNTLSANLRQTLLGVRPDGRVPRQVAARLRAAVREERRQGGERSPLEIASELPPFETLSPQVVETLYASVLRDDSWSMWLRRASWRQALIRATRTIAMKVPARRKRMRHFMDIVETYALLWHARVLHELYRAALSFQGWVGREPTLPSALKMAGLDPRAVASMYLHGTPQPAETAGYWHDAARHNTVGVVVGIDFIVNDEGVWFVESNLNAGLMEQRSRLYETDPFVENLVRFARQHGYTSVTFLACNDYPVDPIMAARIQQAAQAQGIRATVIEDGHSPRGHLSQTVLVPPVSADRTLVVRSKLYHTTLDALFHNKTLSLHALQAYQARHPDRDVGLPLTGEASFPETLSMEGPLPNLVYKFPERDQGQGVMFLKVPSLARAREILADTTEVNRRSVATVLTKLRYRLKLEEQTGVFQAYVPSYLVEGRRLCIARAHVLATPVGLTYLSAHRVVSNIPVPESLAEGLVEQARPYIVNYSLDSEHASMPDDEEARVRKAALGVVEALCWAVEDRFQVTPQTQRHAALGRVPA